MCSRSTTRVGFYITCVDEPQEQNMEFVPLSDDALRYLALDDPILKRVFQGVDPSDGLPSRPTRTMRAAYIVNTDPRGEPGKHWLGLWMEEGACEVMHTVFEGRKTRPCHYCYAVWQPQFDGMKRQGIQFHERIPEVADLQT